MELIEIKKTKMLVLVLGALFLVSMMFSTTMITSFAEDNSTGDDDGIDDDFEDLNHREITVQYSPTAVEIKSELEDGNREDEIQLHLIADSNGLKVELNYNSESESTEIELKLEVIFYSLIEYIDTNADGTYNESVDTFIGETLLNSFQPISYVTQTTASNNSLHIVSVTTTDGVFTIKLYATEEFEIVNNSTITPTEAKLDIEIHNFAYVDGTSDLALKVKLITSTEYEYEIDENTEDEYAGYAENEMEVETKGTAYTGFFSWAKNALIDGIEQEVKASPLNNEPGNEMIYLNYPRGTHIIHDPKVGIQGLIRYPISWASLISVAFVIAAVVVVTAIFLRRKSIA